MIPRPKSVADHLRFDAVSFVVFELNISNRFSAGKQRALEHGRIPNEEVQLRELCDAFYRTTIRSLRKGMKQHQNTCEVEVTGLVEVSKGTN
ncbi:hypothetical protein F01_650005 [Burkholderia cenocepacia]|nr:hypothetical protein F01_650005 [Burkholderia cenocepacia]